jgi:hypothetical protein
MKSKKFIVNCPAAEWVHNWTEDYLAQFKQTKAIGEYHWFDVRFVQRDANDTPHFEFYFAEAYVLDSDKGDIIWDCVDEFENEFGFETSLVF